MGMPRNGPITPANFLDLPGSFAELIDPSRTALVMWDMQKGLAGKAPNLPALKMSAASLLSAAEKAGVLVVWSQHIFPRMNQMTGPWLTWMMKKQGVACPEDLQPMFQPGSKEVEFLDGFEPKSHHLIFKKQQPSLFIDTPFAHHLKVQGIRSIVLVGFATDIGVEFTARHAIALGYHVIVVEDATGAYVQAGHDRSIAFLRDWAEVAKASQVVDEWTEISAQKNST